jgi:hypothetical protein
MWELMRECLAIIVASVALGVAVGNAVSIMRGGRDEF